MIQKIKYFFTTLLLALFVVQPVFANNLDEGDMAFAFDNFSDGKELGNLDRLTDKEMLETEGDLVPLIIGGFHIVRYGRYAVGPVRAWLRYGNSYSRSGGFKTKSVRWGSNSHYREKIGSPTLRNWNARLHNSRISGRSWRTRDSGHFHIRKR